MIEACATCDPVDIDDGILFQRWQTGDAAAFDTLVCRHQPGLTRLCGRLLEHPQAAEVDDAVQEVLLLLHRRAPDLLEPQAVGAWMRRAAFGVCANLNRSRNSRRVRERIAADHLYRIGTIAPDSTVAADSAVRILSALPCDQREVVELHYLEGLDLPSLASRLQITPAAARKRLQRGVGSLRERFKRERAAVALLALLAWCRASESGGSEFAASMTGKAAGVALVLGTLGLLAWQQPWQSETCGSDPVSTITSQPTPTSGGNDANSGIPSGDSTMFTRTAIALALATAATAATDGQSTTPDYCTANAATCPIAKAFKTTNKAEIVVADVVAEIKNMSKEKIDIAKTTKMCEGYQVAMDSDKNGAVSKNEYNAFCNGKR